ncbi:MAG: ATP-grasp domain-containing protein, partial [Myxococcales bacterium]
MAANITGANGASREAGGCVVLVMHTTSYNIDAFVRAADGAGLRVVIASDRCHVLDGVWQWPGDSLVIDFYDPVGAATVIASGARALALVPVRAVIPVGGEVAALVATLASRLLGLRGNAPEAAEAAANKLRMRQLCARAIEQGAPLRVPAFAVFPYDGDPAPIATVVGRTIGWPCVLKPLLLSASRGVIRADDPGTFAAAFSRLHRFLATPALLHMSDGAAAEADIAVGVGRIGAVGGAGHSAARQILVEAFVPGAEVALEGLLTGGMLRTLALFDKPDPLEGPYFEETLYITPSRHPAATQAAVEEAVREAARALGLETGPVHAEVRLGPDGPVVIEVAARTIGGLCSRTLRFGTGLSLEDVVIRQATGQFDEAATSGDAAPAALTRAPAAAGVMMIPIPAGGVLKGVRGVATARAVPEIEDVVISAGVGQTLVPLPEGASYLGFIFARGSSPEVVE